MNGYQSDLTFDRLKGAGNIPLDCLLGGYGLATLGFGPDYSLVLDPPLTEYKTGVVYRVEFDYGNLGAPVTLDIDGLGPKPIKKVVGTNTVDVATVGGINALHAYLLMDRGSFFEILNVPIRPTMLEYLHANFDVHTLGNGSDEQTLGDPLRLHRDAFSHHPLIEVKCAGMLSSAEQKVLRLTFADQVLFEYASADQGTFQLQLTIVRRPQNKLKSFGHLLVNNVVAAAIKLETASIDFSGSHFLRFTAQAPIPAPGSVQREMFIVKGTTNNNYT